MPPNTKADKEKLQQSLHRLWEIFEDIDRTVNKVSRWRCPYKNKQDRCTAQFGCRNQSYTDGRDRPALCVGSDHLNYSSAWEIE